MRASVAFAVLGLAACGGRPGSTTGPDPHTPDPHGAPAVIANRRPPPRPLPAECARKPAEPGYAPWDRRPAGGCLGVARTVDEGWVVLTFDKLAAYDRDGHPRWETSLDRPGPDGRRCGYPDGLAVDADSRVVVTCGYSVLGFAADGTFRWQVWPGGNHRVTAPLVDAAGTIYVAIEGALYALASDGATRWHVETGFNRYVGAFAPTESGQLVFQTQMAALHSDDTGHGHFYYEYEPPELFVVDRAGKVVSRTVQKDGEQPAWPAWVDVVGEGGGRIP